jgi:hypothetical protein
MTDRQQDSSDLNNSELTNSELNSPELSFSYLNQHISARIYLRFTQGKIIPKQGYDKLKSSSFDDRDYTYLFRYVDEFTLLYRLIGKQLEHNAQGEFFYISSASDGDEDEADEHALKTQSILLVLARYFEMSGRSIDNLSVDSLGFNDKDIAEIAANDEYNAICKALRLANWPKAIEYLLNRGFAFETSSNHYFLSSAGKAFCDAVIEAYDNK